MAEATDDASEPHGTAAYKVSPEVQPVPAYCPWYGSCIAEWGHDDNCSRPPNVELRIGPWTGVHGAGPR